MSLYLTTQRSLEIYNMIEQNEGEVPEELFDEMMNNEGRFEEQVAAVQANIKEDEALVAAAREEKKRLDNLIKKKLSSIESKKSLIMKSMDNLKIKNVDMGLDGKFTLSQRRNLDWDNVDVDSLDPEYVRLKKSVDKSLLKKEYGDAELEDIGVVISQVNSLTLRAYKPQDNSTEW